MVASGTQERHRTGQRVGVQGVPTGDLVTGLRLRPQIGEDVTGRVLTGGPLAVRLGLQRAPEQVDVDTERQFGELSFTVGLLATNKGAHAHGGTPEIEGMASTVAVLGERRPPGKPGREYGGRWGDVPAPLCPARTRRAREAAGRRAEARRQGEVVPCLLREHGLPVQAYGDVTFRSKPSG